MRISCTEPSTVILGQSRLKKFKCDAQKVSKQTEAERDVVRNKLAKYLGIL